MRDRHRQNRAGLEGAIIRRAEWFGCHNDLVALAGIPDRLRHPIFAKWSLMSMAGTYATSVGTPHVPPTRNDKLKKAHEHFSGRAALAGPILNRTTCSSLKSATPKAT
jgi:hypothetical protein